MKRIFLFIFLAGLIACTPQVTITSEATAALTPVETLIPTATVNPQFQSLQDQIAKSDIYTLTKDGFEMKNEE